MRALFKIICLVLLGLLFGVAGTVNAQTVYANTKPFTIAHHSAAPGDILIVGNTSLSCLTSALCTNARDAQGAIANFNNDDWPMRNVVTDPAAPSNATTTLGANSSIAGLTIPAGATVLWASLYWGAQGTAGTAAGRGQINFQTPAVGYQTITADWIVNNGNDFHAAKNVTPLVIAGGSGNYAVANIKASLSVGSYAGWSLVVVYQLNSEQFRDLTVFDGYSQVTSTNPVNIAINGFVTPAAGPVGARVGFVAYEGDRRSATESLLLNGSALSNGLNPANNSFNSSITRLGTRISDKTPDYVNQLGFDIDVFDASGILTPGSNSANVAMSTSGIGAEFYYPGVITTAIDIYVPNLSASLTKTVSDINGGVLNPGDTLEYSISFKNTGQDSATKVFVVDPIPLGTTYVAGSLKIAAGTNAGSKTDGASDDQAEFDGALNRVVFRLGTGANSTAGGSFAPNDSTTITFQVRVSAGTSGQLINNTATISYEGATLTTTFMASASAAIAVANLPVLTHQKIVQVLSDPVNGTNNPKNIPGAVNLYTLTIQNTGSGTANSLTIADLISTNSELFTGNFSTATGVLSPFLFTNGTTVSGLTCNFVAIGDATDCVEFSNNGGTSWGFTPNGAYDPAVTNIRFRLAGTMNPAATAGTPPYPSFTLQFKTRIK